MLTNHINICDNGYRHDKVHTATVHESLMIRRKQLIIKCIVISVVDSYEIPHCVKGNNERVVHTLKTTTSSNTDITSYPGSED